MAADSRLEAVLRAFSASNACVMRDKPSSVQVSAVDLTQSHQHYRKHKTLLRKTIARAAAICHRMMHAADGRDWKCSTVICGEKQEWR